MKENGKETSILLGRRISGIIAISMILLTCTVLRIQAKDMPARPAREISDTVSRPVSGIVEDENGSPVIGAHVIVKGAPVESGTSTDLEGKFTITVPPKGVLEISFIGYHTLELPVRSNQQNIVAVMEEETEQLDNVVIVGYGTQKKSGDTTGDNASDVLYVPGVYTSTIELNGQTFDVEVSVDENHINSIALNNLSETATAMYPLMEPTLESLASQIYATQSTENISFGDDNKYTSQLLLQAINAALDKAKPEDEK